MTWHAYLGGFCPLSGCSGSHPEVGYMSSCPSSPAPLPVSQVRVSKTALVTSFPCLAPLQWGCLTIHPAPGPWPSAPTATRSQFCCSCPVRQLRSARWEASSPGPRLSLPRWSRAPTLGLLKSIPPASSHLLSSNTDLTVTLCLRPQWLPVLSGLKTKLPGMTGLCMYPLLLLGCPSALGQFLCMFLGVLSWSLFP